MSRLHVILRVHVTYGRMAIGPRLTTGQYVMQFRFYWWRHVFRNGANGPQSKAT